MGTHLVRHLLCRLGQAARGADRLDDQVRGGEGRDVGNAEVDMVGDGDDEGLLL